MPDSLPFRLLIEGWRDLPHSYSIVNQFQCLELLRRPDVLLRHRDMPYYSPSWLPMPGVFDAAGNARIKAIPAPLPGDSYDALLRMDFPHRVTPATGMRTCVFLTAEYKLVRPTSIAGGQSLAQPAGADVLYITPSHWSKKGLIRSGAVENRIAVVPHGVDNAVFHPLPPDARADLRKRTGLNGFMFAHFSSMSGNKNLWMILKAFAVVAGRHPDARLFLKGMEALYASQKFAAAANERLTPAELAVIEPRIIYRGDTFTFARLAQLYQVADAYVAPYAAEGFNLPVLEAAACGVPVICTAGGATDDFTTPEFALRIDAAEADCPFPEGVIGTKLVPSLDSLIAHMLAVIQTPAIAERARVAGPAFVAEGFLWPHVVERLLGAMRGNI